MPNDTSQRLQVRISSRTLKDFQRRWKGRVGGISSRIRELIMLDMEAHRMTKRGPNAYCVAITNALSEMNSPAPAEVPYMPGVEEISINGDVRKVRQNKRKAR